MIRKLLEKKGLMMSDEEFREVMQATTDDIKFHSLGFGHMTTISQVLAIAEISYSVFKR